MHFVLTIERSSFEAGVSQQRLRVKLDPHRPGVIMDMHQYQLSMTKKFYGNGSERKVGR